MLTTIAIAVAIVAACAVTFLAIGIAAVVVLAKKHPDDVRFDK